jgi:2-haloacid dehalogenase
MRDMVRRDFLQTVPGLLMAGNAWGASSAQAQTAGPGGASGIAASVEALVFDTFGTVVDYRGTIIGEGTALGKAKGLKVDWAKFADAWRGGYAPAMGRVRKGELPWTKLDVLHRLILDKVLEDFRITGLSEAEKNNLNNVWHRLKPWPDAVSGLTRLKRKYIIAPLSNGNVRLMVDMAKNAGLPWDCILGAEVAKHYKPDKEVYLQAAEFMSVPPEKIIMVAAHRGDLRAARALGFRTAFVARPDEGPLGEKDNTLSPEWDFAVNSFNELADRLGIGS